MLACFSLVFSLSVALSCGEELLTPLGETASDLDWPKDKKKLGKPDVRLPICTTPKSSYHCEDLHFDYGIQCVGNQIFLTPCYCLSSDSRLGHCQFTCFRNTFLVTSDNASLLREQCSPFNRAGMFCGECSNNTGYPVYSFSLKCIECDTSWKSIVKYVAVAYVPLALFVCVLVAFRISVNTVPLLGFILVAQTANFPFQMRLAVGMIEAEHIPKYQRMGLRILGSVYGIWNLDFFRSVYQPFCFSSNWTTIETMCLDYIIAAYPFIFILLIYTAVEFYSRGYRLFCWWKPFHWCLSRLKNGMNIKIPLVDAFGTFFSLSYAKTLSTSFDILSITAVWDKGGIKGYVPYYAATDKFDAKFVILGLTMFVVFNVLPIVVLLAYSLKKALVRADVEDVNGFFRPLLNTLLAPYKDGRDGTCNCRYFSAVYPTVRIILVVVLLISPNIFFQLLAAIVFLIVGMLVAIIKPYKSDLYNTVDTVLVLSLSVAYMSILSYFYAHFISPASINTAVVFAVIACNIPLLYSAALITYYAVFVKQFPQRLLYKLSKVLSEMKTFLCLWLQTRRRRSPQHERPSNIRPRGTMYVAIESGTVRVSNVDLSVVK
ncbi:hypothetical protein GBAR_LOCUS28316 [Geodia barretti]|uniref:Uncharacterized protein n=1 Tax=Geodia barretti TaxID=519541 RepID=A0AA35XHK7_GEOBA|nr:hypothetical protein GBAR_LOCUS28316 [Geodia barretti]